MTGPTKLARRTLAAFGVAALAVVGVASAATALPGPDQPGAPTSGSLTVNKYKGAPTPTPNPADLLSGVEFVVTPVGTLEGGTCTAIDTATFDGWAGLDALFATAPAAPAGGYCLLPTQTVEETANGTATFEDLDLGVYYVQEGADNGNNNIVSKVPSFYVSIPLPSSNDWIYDVVTNPKNAVVNQPSKTISEAPGGVVVGSTVTWNLTVPVPVLNNDELFTQAVITDVLHASLSYTSSVLTLNGTPLVEGADYTVDGAGVTWTFTPAGRAKLDAAAADTTADVIAVQLVTRVDEVTADGIVPNEDYSSTFNGTTVPGEVTPYTYWGQLHVTKNDGAGTALQGAEFQVFDAAVAGVCPAEVPATGAVATGTSDAAGVVQWAGVTPTSPLGLWVANSSDGPLVDPSHVYCVYETAVPAGYTAQPFTTAQTITPGSSNAVVLAVSNPQVQGPDLPLTGAGGTLAMTVGGLALIGVGVGTVVVTRRRRRTAA
ncbi:hypothetical protein C8046_10055 [Serinibacter arcticus]|uniref:Gram-positive cocci surface proteins LPxTG domain-containing protein n=1 Tax=Serinibacter arcticus TaxID=1655435 RepID=A0A2U1ZVC6_9MICO|nr:SpaH/EbpB family LPXTG-anchored major pilin [Serinibacter arcticus]PWD50945.1 hypothetical protein C8046_10055 [Serinibacter arcticus]